MSGCLRLPRPEKIVETPGDRPIRAGRPPCRSTAAWAKKFLKIEDNHRKLMISEVLTYTVSTTEGDDAPILFGNLSIGERDQNRPAGPSATS